MILLMIILVIFSLFIIGLFIEEASITNDPVTIALNKNVVAINSAVEVDITGQGFFSNLILVCADSVGSRMIRLFDLLIQ